MAIATLSVRILVSIGRAGGSGETWELGSRDKYRSPTRRPAGEVSLSLWRVETFVLDCTPECILATMYILIEPSLILSYIGTWHTLYTMCRSVLLVLHRTFPSPHTLISVTTTMILC